ANNGTAAGVTTEGAQIGRGIRFDGTATLPVPAGTSLAWAAGGKASWSAWIKPADADATSVVFSRRAGAVGVVAGLHDGKPFVQIEAAAGEHRAEATAKIAAAKWHLLAFIAGDETALYVDGVQAATVAAKLPVLNGPSLLGGDTPDSSPARKPRLANFKGEL